MAFNCKTLRVQLPCQNVTVVEGPQLPRVYGLAAVFLGHPKPPCTKFTWRCRLILDDVRTELVEPEDLPLLRVLLETELMEVVNAEAAVKERLAQQDQD